ncbi:MAG: hypothetical protein ACTSQY_04470, partial [Candidatus Odinarchaeia archaeon]
IENQINILNLTVFYPGNSEYMSSKIEYIFEVTPFTDNNSNEKTVNISFVIAILALISVSTITATLIRKLK